MLLSGVHWGRLGGLGCLVLSTAIIGTWFIYLYRIVPPISRADFLWAMWHRASLIEEHEWGTVVARIFELFGGHIVAYTRTLQLINYLVFDYSGLFVRWSVIGAYAAAWLSMIIAALREDAPVLTRGLTALIGTLLVASPAGWEIYTWSDAAVPYWSCFIVLMAGGQMAARALFRPDESKTGRSGIVIFFAVAVVIGSGVGWGVLPAIALAWAVGNGRFDKLMLSPRWALHLLLCAVVALAIALLVREAVLSFMAAYEQRFWLDDARHGLQNLFSFPDVAARYCFALIATNFRDTPYSQSWPLGACVVAYWLCIVLVLGRQGRARANTFWILVGLFGLLSAVLTTIARWEFVVTRGLDKVPQYYSIFSIPIYLSASALTLSALRRPDHAPVGQAHGRGAWIGTGAIVGIAAMIVGFALKDIRQTYTRAFANAESMADWHLAARFGAQNWNLMHVVRIAGASEYVQQYLFGLMADFKRLGKYHALTDGFVNDPDAFARAEKIPQPLNVQDLVSAADSALCNADLRDGGVWGRDEDRRLQWHFREAPVSFVRFYGFARNRDNCDARVDHVFATDRLGRILCVARTGSRMWWDLPPELKETRFVRSEFIFDFSCPLPDGEPSDAASYTIVSYVRKTGQLMRIPAVSDGRQ